MKSNKQYKVLELFAGAGGLALGLEMSGFESLGLVELDKHAGSTLRLNRPNWNVFNMDIRDFNLDLNNYIKMDSEIDLISGGFPCQPFSYAGMRLGLQDTRGTLFFEFANIVQKLQPKMLLAENVRGLKTHNDGKTLETILKSFYDIGYNVQYKILNANNYDVAQKRERMVIIGIRKDLPNTYKYPEPSTNKLVLQDVLKDVPLSEGAKYSENKRKILELIPPGGCWRDLPENIAKEYLGGSYFLCGGKTGMARRIAWHEPSLTLTCSPAQKQTERCHPDEIRPFTVREYARIQSFPDTWEFCGSMLTKYKQIGNAVPVNMAKHIGLSIINCLNGKIHASKQQIQLELYF
ncbi:MAG: DNA cytosine methyltransferase [Burkholderiales bacterium]|nr:DNA cytosine methyltransferase [Burkholderiales bacterium]